MNKEIKYLKQRLEWIKELELELSCYRKDAECSLKIIEKMLRKQEDRKNGKRN